MFSKLPYNWAASSVWIDDSHRYRSEGPEFARIVQQRYDGQPLQRAAMFMASGTPWESGPPDLLLYVRVIMRKWAHFKMHNESLHDVTVRERNLINDSKIDRLQKQVDSISKQYSSKTGASRPDASMKSKLRKQALTIVDQITEVLRVFVIRRTVPDNLAG